LKQYETTIIMDAQLKEEGWEKTIDKYSAIINQNGTIGQIDRWGVRRLAYEIEKQTHGFYVHVIHESAPSVLRELERQFQLDESCLRYLTVVADNPKYIEVMNKTKARQAPSDGGAESARAADTSTPPVTTPATDVGSASDEPERPATEADATADPETDTEQEKQ
jgi:small subunit ribosomal protein S6